VEKLLKHLLVETMVMRASVSGMQTMGRVWKNQSTSGEAVVSSGTNWQIWGLD
jgi:hypothetical protein